MRTFTYNDAKSTKFWNIELQGDRCTVTFGRTGTAGQTQIKDFPDAATEKAAHDKLIREKLAKGYVETAAAAPPAVPLAHPAQAALEQALVENPDDLAAHAAYADLLSEQGDPRGEFIRVQLALEDEGRPAKERKVLQKREQQLLKAHQREWLGELAEYLLDGRAVAGEETPADNPGYEFRFARGHLDSLDVSRLSLDFAARLADAPQARLLRWLAVVGSYYNEGIDEKTRRKFHIPEHAGIPGLYPLLRAPWLANLRVFQLGELGDEILQADGSAQTGYSVYYKGNCHTDGTLAAAFVRQMPRLEELYLLANDSPIRELFRLKTLKHQRILQVYHAYQYPLEVLAANPALGRLTHLLLHPKASGYWSDDAEEEAPYIKLKGVRAVLRSPHLKSLTYLRLRLAEVGDKGCEEIVRSGILKRLKVLDLRHGTITNAGARILAGCPDIGRLELLDLMRNQLTPAGIKLLKAAVPNLKADYQQTPEQVEQGQYLYEGDYE